AGDVQRGLQRLGLGRDLERGRGRAGRRGEAHGWPGGGGALAEQVLAPDPGGDRGHRGDAADGHELTPVDGVRHRVLLRLPPRSGALRSGALRSGALRSGALRACGYGATGADARCSHSSAAAPAAPPMIAGRTSVIRPPVLVITMKALNRANAARLATPSAAARRLSAPIPSARQAIARY